MYVIFEVRLDFFILKKTTRKLSLACFLIKL